MKTFIPSVGLLAGLAAAQQSGYGQCGGSGWSGATACVSGFTCVAQNTYYAQCVPGAGSAPAPAPVPVPTTTSKVATTSKPATTLTTSKVSSSTKSAAPVPTTVAAGSYAKTDGTLFNIDGVTKYYMGTNCYWCGFLTVDNDVDFVFNNMATAGLKIVRVWGFNDVNTIPAAGTVYYQYLSATGSTINTGATGLGRLDVVVAAAQKHGIKLIINFVNNWNDYGGKNAYVNAFGGNASTWYTNTAAQAQYKTYIKAVVSRYSTSTAVFAWELANEPRCDSCDTSVIYNWVKSTSAYIKSLDANHMVAIGDEGFGPLTNGDGSYPYQTGAGGYVWADTLNITTIDFGTLHLYPDSWGQPIAWGSSWVSTHGAKCAAAGKPCMLEEYGGDNSCANENPWQWTAGNTTGYAADLFWQYGDTLPSSGTQTSQDGNTVYYQQGNWDCMVADHIKAINAKYP